MTGPLILWLLFIAWVIHDIEEYLFFDRLSVSKDAGVQNIASKLSVPKNILNDMATTKKQEGIAILIVGSLMLLATLAGYLNPDGIGMRFYGLVLGGTSLHTFSHAGSAVILRKYTPGVVTAVAVVLPACVFIYVNLFGQQLLGIVEAIILAVLGIVAFAPLLLMVQRIAKRLTK